MGLLGFCNYESKFLQINVSVVFLRYHALSSTTAGPDLTGVEKEQRKDRHRQTYGQKHRLRKAEIGCSGASSGGTSVP